MVELREVITHKDLRTFIYLPEKIHKNHDSWLPPIYIDEWSFFNPKKNRAFAAADTLMLVAFKDGKAVGRIMGIIHRTYNQLRNEHHARFGYLECFNDTEVAHALLGRIEQWAKEKGMVKVVGPYGFSDKDPQGFLIEGFEHMPVIDSACNFPYMISLVEQEGYTKEVDCMIYKLNLEKSMPILYERVQQRLESTNGYSIREFTSRKQLKPWVVPILEIVNKTYGDLYGFVPMEQQEMLDLANRYLTIIDPRYVKVVFSGDEPVAFIIGLPNFSPGIQKAKGRILPFGFIHILRSIKRSRQLDLMLGAVLPEHRGKGLEISMAMKLIESCKMANMNTIEVHLVLETNTRMLAELERAGAEFHKRFRVFQKML